MAKDTYLCQQCRNVFKLTMTGSITPEEKEVKCPNCGSSQIEVLRSWAPTGFDSHEGKTLWEYECQQCQNVFKLPVPSSPSQEKEIKCPECGGSHIHRLTIFGYEPLHCG